MTKRITREFILEGAVRAIYASRVFLIDAIFLYENQHYGAAYVVGVIATEQLGRATWMMAKYNELKATNDLSTQRRKFATTLRQIKHMDNLRKGVMSSTMKSTPETIQLSNIIQTSPANSPEQIKAFERQREIYLTQFEETIRTYHHTREQTQYVNPDKTYKQWTSPTQVTPEQVKALLQNVGTDNRVASMFYLDPASDMGKMVDKLGMRSYLQDYKTTWLTEKWNKLPERYRK